MGQTHLLPNYQIILQVNMLFKDLLNAMDINHLFVEQYGEVKEQVNVF